MTWHKAAKTTDLPEDDEVIGVDVAGEPIAIYRIDGDYYATHNVCTHEFAVLSDGFVEEGCIECPLHQGVFHIATGECRGGPVDEPIRTYKVRIDGDDILVEIPD